MTRIFIDFDSNGFADKAHASEGSTVQLDSELSHHLRDVLRLSQGNQLSVVDKKSGSEYLAIIASVSKDKLVQVQIVKKIETKPATPVLSTLACGLPKGSHADQICEQVSQLGIGNIVFWSADRSVAQPKQAQSKLERWQKIAESSARQSKQNHIPKILYFGSSNEFYSYLDNRYSTEQDMLALCSLNPEAQLLSKFKTPQGRAHLIVGPEGDFSPDELAAFNQRGATHISLGPIVLRVETAAIVGAAMALAAWGWRD